MNKPFAPPTAAASLPGHLPSPDTAAASVGSNPLRYAHAVLTGENDPRPAIDFLPLYSDDEWREAAYLALDGDHADLVFMHYREEAFQAFQQWVRNDYDRREFEDFGNWLVDHSCLYREALTVDERKAALLPGLLTDAELSAHSADQRKFNREHRA